MSVDRYAALCERILAYCSQRNWYGSDIYLSGYVGAFYDEGILRNRKLTHDPRTGFKFPPATEEQPRQTENIMGFPHPPLLRMLYLQLANGGFGPGSRITGAFGGHCYWVGRDVRYNAMQREHYLKTYGSSTFANCSDFFEEGLLDLVQYEQRHDNPTLIRLGPHVWPMHFLHLCDWG